jgi:Icc-related predicted phosphoesterase
MDNYITVLFITVDIKTGELLNNLINEKQINYDIIKNKSYQINLTNNNSDLCIEKLIKKKEIFCIITNDDYKSLIKLMYNDEQQIINYNNDYYILEIEPYLSFDTNYSKLLSIQKNLKFKI